MITGDAEAVAQSVGRELGVDRVFAGVRPEDKSAKVAELQREGKKVAMVGDGVNDAPALAQADVGIAIGAGTDVAIASAGVILASDDPRSVLSVIELSRAGYRKMTQNLWWAAGYNLISVPLAAGVLAPFGFVLPMSVGAILMSLSTIVVALNAQLLRRLDLRPREQHAGDSRRRTMTVGADPARVRVLRRRIRMIVAFTITYNVIEGIIALIAGGIASSAALIGFGLDSFVEVLSAAAIAWQFSAVDPETREKPALRIIAVSFFALAAYVTVDAVLSLTGLREPEHSPVGIALGRGEPGGHARRELDRAARGQRARVRLRGRGLAADPDLRLPVGSSPDRTGAEQRARMGVGRLDRRPVHRRVRRARRSRGLARRGVHRAGRGAHG